MCLAQVYVKIQIVNLLVGQKNCSFKLCQFSNCLKIQTNIFFQNRINIPDTQFYVGV